MRKSNKLLIGLLSFVTVLILMHYTAVAVMVAYDIRAERKDYEDENQYTEGRPEGIRAVDISGFYNVHVVMGDSFCYRVFNSREKQAFTVEKVSDTLVLSGFYTSLDTVYKYTDGKRELDRIDTAIHIHNGVLVMYVTGKEALKLYQSSVQLMEAHSPLDLRIALVNSNFSGPNYEQDSIARLRRLEISSKDRSHITLNDKMKCEELHLSFSDHGILSGSTAIGTGTLRYNDSTMMSGEMFGYLFRNMKMIHQPFVPTHTTDDAPGVAVETSGP